MFTVPSAGAVEASREGLGSSAADVAVAAVSDMLQESRANYESRLDRRRKKLNGGL